MYYVSFRRSLCVHIQLLVVLCVLSPLSLSFPFGFFFLFYFFFRPTLNEVLFIFWIETRFFLDAQKTSRFLFNSLNHHHLLCNRLLSFLLLYRNGLYESKTIPCGGGVHSSGGQPTGPRPAAIRFHPVARFGVIGSSGTGQSGRLD